MCPAAAHCARRGTWPSASTHRAPPVGCCKTNAPANFRDADFSRFQTVAESAHETFIRDDCHRHTERCRCTCAAGDLVFQQRLVEAGSRRSLQGLGERGLQREDGLRAVRRERSTPRNQLELVFEQFRPTIRLVDAIHCESAREPLRVVATERHAEQFYARRFRRSAERTPCTAGP